MTDQKACTKKCNFEKVVKTILLIAAMAMCVGTFFRVLHWPGGTLTLLISTGLVSIALLCMHKPWSIGLGLLLVGLFFRFNHLPGGTLMSMIFAAVMFICLIIELVRHCKNNRQ